MRNFRHFAVLGLLSLLVLPISAQAGTVSVSAGKLSYVAPAGQQNVIAVGQSGSTVTLGDSAGVVDGDGPGGCSVASGTATCPGVSSAEVNAGDGDDTVCTVAAPDPACKALPTDWYRERVSISSHFPDLPLTVDGGPGNDRVHGGDGSDLLRGGPGNDWLYAHRGAQDRLEGGDGNDKLQPHTFFYDAPGPIPNAAYSDTGTNVLDGGAGSDEMRESAGYDTVDYSSRTAKVKVDLQNHNVLEFVQGESGEGDALENFEAILTGSGSDDIRPRQLYNWFQKSIPNLVSTGVGNDKITTYTDEFTIDSGPGKDLIKAKDGGPHVILGGPDDDKIYSSWRDDTVDGGDGNDRITDQDGNDLITGGSGVNTIKAGWGYDTVFSLPTGRDKIYGGNGVDNLVTNDGDNADYVGCGIGANAPGPLDPAPVADSGDRVLADCFDTR